MVSETEKQQIEAIPCSLCEGGMMRRAVIKPYNVNCGIVMLIVGALCVVTGVMSLIGLILVLVGAYFTFSKKDVWLCSKCDATVERI